MHEISPLERHYKNTSPGGLSGSSGEPSVDDKKDKADWSSSDYYIINLVIMERIISFVSMLIAPSPYIASILSL